MGNSLVTVRNDTLNHICIVCFNGLDMLYSDYNDNEMFVIAPGDDCSVQGVLSANGLQVAVISDIHPAELYHSCDLWWVKTGATLTVTEVDSSRRVVTAQGDDCESYGRAKKLYDAKRPTNLRMCLNLFKHHAIATPPSTDPDPYFASAPCLLIDNSHSSTAVELLDIFESFMPLSTNSCAMTAISAPFPFHIFAPGTVSTYAYVKLPHNLQVLWPGDWPLSDDCRLSRACKHLQLHNSNRYTLLMDPCTDKSTVVVTSSTGSQYMKVVPLPLPSSNDQFVQRLVQVLNVLLSCFEPGSDPYLVGRLENHAGGESKVLSSPPPDLVTDLAAWFKYCDTTNRGSVSQAEIVEGLKRTFGKDLDAATLGKLQQSVASIWGQVFSGSIDYAASHVASPCLGAEQDVIHEMNISLEVFLEEEGLGTTLAEYVAPLYQNLDLIFNRIRAVSEVSESVDGIGRTILSLSSGCAITRQHIFDILVSQHGDAGETQLILQQMHPTLAPVLGNINLADPSAPPLPESKLPSPQPSAHSLSWPSSEDFSTLDHPEVRVCALASRDIYLCASGTGSDEGCGSSEGTQRNISEYERIKWSHLASGE